MLRDACALCKLRVAKQIEALKATGVTEVFVVVNKEQEEMTTVLKDFETKLQIQITCLCETEGLGSAGSLAFAKEKLMDGSPFFVLNSNVICEYPLELLIDFHRSHNREASIMVTKVDDPLKYSVVVMEEATGKVESYVEMPKTVNGNYIDAGIYLLNSSVLDRIKLRRTSLEKVFSKIAAKQELYAMVLTGFWMHNGRPKDYLIGIGLYLDALRKKNSSELSAGSHIRGNVLIDGTAVIGEDCLIGPNVAIGPECVVEAGVRLSNCVLMRGACIKKHSCICSSIIGWHCSVGAWARVDNLLIFFEDVHITDEVYCNGRLVPPRKEINDRIEDFKIFTSEDVKRLTNDFCNDRLLGSSSHGSVFMGILEDSSVVAIKSLKGSAKKSYSQVLHGMMTLSQLKHPSVVQLIGCCVESEQVALVYEYMPNGSLYEHLQGLHPSTSRTLTWRERLNIALEAADRLAYLHTAAVPPLYHKDVKSNNILLNETLSDKITDLALSRLVRASGTLGYVDPEYSVDSLLIDKSDVYSFGVVLLELLTSRKAIEEGGQDDNLVAFAKKKKEENGFMDVVDSGLREAASLFHLETMKELAVLAFRCLEKNRHFRPTMKEVAEKIKRILLRIETRFEEEF
ncbi:hypothetical protein Sjap_013477 [Stephania japonica]|uniref:Protein kinase domain-containing protein n=1 Tax=Stephania japonica TaxID=461633 RepID=A0AAP0IYS2_9MAGN